MSGQYNDPKLKIFALNSNKPLAEKIAASVGVELGKTSVDALAMARSGLISKKVFVEMKSLSCNQLLHP